MAKENHYIFAVLIISALIPVLASSRAISEDASMRERHIQWMSQYGRKYENAIEEEERYWIFKANVEYIDSVNAGENPFKLAVNRFADMTNEEFKATYMAHSNRNKAKPVHTTAFDSESLVDIPPSIDWRKKGAVTPLRDGTCGAWTFPAVDTVEGATKIKSGTLYRLSTQEIVDCYSTGSFGCDGGFITDAFDFIAQYGLTTEENYPSNETTGTCKKDEVAKPVTKISGYKNVPADDEWRLAEAVAGQPVAVSIDASGPGFQFYSSGVFTGQCGTDLDHGVTVVGYGFEEGKLKYWIIKNCWGPEWGEKGYMRLQRDVKSKQGLCGIAMEAMYPLVDC